MGDTLHETPPFTTSRCSEWATTNGEMGYFGAVMKRGPRGHEKGAAHAPGGEQSGSATRPAVSKEELKKV